MTTNSTYTLTVTIAWDEIIGRDGTRALTVESTPFTRRLNNGGWKFKVGDKLIIRVQLIDRTSPEGLCGLVPGKINLTTCPSLRNGVSGLRTPFCISDDERLRDGIGLVEPTEPIRESKMFDLKGNNNEFELVNAGDFDFTVGVSFKGPQNNRDVWRVFRTDPEMNVEPSH